MPNEKRFVKELGKRVTTPYGGKILNGTENIVKSTKTNVSNGTEGIFNGQIF